MKKIKIFLIAAVLTVGCQNQDDLADLEVNLQGVDEFDSSHLAKDPAPSPHEFLIIETASVEGEDPYLTNLN